MLPPYPVVWSKSARFLVELNFVRQARVCTENSIRIDLVTESPNVIDDGRAAMVLTRTVRFAFQVEEPT